MNIIMISYVLDLWCLVTMLQSSVRICFSNAWQSVMIKKTIIHSEKVMNFIYQRCLSGNVVIWVKTNIVKCLCYLQHFAQIYFSSTHIFPMCLQVMSKQGGWFYLKCSSWFHVKHLILGLKLQLSYHLPLFLPSHLFQSPMFICFTLLSFL